MKYPNIVLAIVFSFLFCNGSLAQKQFVLEVSFDAGFDTSEIKMNYDNGLQSNIQIEKEFINNSIGISDNFVTHYLTLKVYYKDFRKVFFIPEGVTRIDFKHSNEGGKPLDNFVSERALDINTQGQKELDEYLKPKMKELKTFFSVVEKTGMSDSLFQIGRSIADSILMKQTRWVITADKNGYYPFWLLKNDIAYNDLLSKDSLLHIFNLFPDKYKNTIEGESIKRIITGLQLQKGDKAPYFDGYSLKGQKISLDDFKGRYLIINFWASWCKPCIGEMPQIVELYNTHAEEISFLFVNRDSDSVKLKESIIKNNIDFGLHIDVNDIMMDSYGAQALPQVYLIDLEGTIIYSRDEASDYDLQQLLIFCNNLFSNNSR